MKTNVLFERLTQKEIEEGQREENGEILMNEGPQAALENIGSQAITYNEWVRRKDAEKRMKQRLINEAKKEVR